jgi:rod shape-determining protein MreD
MKPLSSSGQKRMLLRRLIVYGIAIFFIGVLQCSFFSRLSPFGATPDLILCTVCAIALLDSKKSAAICSIAAGYFIDALGATSPSFSALFYLVAATLAIIIGEKLIPRLLSFLILMLPLLALRGIGTYFNIWIAIRRLPPPSVFLSIILPELISTLVLCIPIYFLIKLCMLPIGARNKFSF